MSNDRIIVIDDDTEIQQTYRIVLSDKEEDGNAAGIQLSEVLGMDLSRQQAVSPRFSISLAGQGPEGVAMVESAIEENQPFAVAFIDIRMPPGYDGLETAIRIRRIDPDIEIVIVTAYSDRSRDEIVQGVGATEKLLFLRKPFDPDELIQLAMSLTAKWNLARKAEERKNELETVLMTTPAAIFTVDENRCVTSWNPAAEQITGYSAQQVLGRPCRIKDIGLGNACGECMLNQIQPNQQQTEVQIKDAKGETRTLLKKITRIRDRKGKIVRLVESFWDITARKAAESALAESEARFRALVETTSDWVWETDASGNFIYCSPLSEEIYGYQPRELVGNPLFDLLVHPDDIPETRALFNECVEQKCGFHNVERQSLTKEGELIYIESSGMPVMDDKDCVVGFRGIDRDITSRKAIENERRDLEIQYRQSQKLEALGTLAGGIAHDLNNVLMPIMGGAQLSLSKMDSTHPIYDNLKTVEKGVQKATELLHQILAFSRKQMIAPQPLNFSLLIKGFFMMLRRLIRENIQLSLELEKDLWTIEADKNQMEQILINLVVNAQDAITESGEVIIRTANQQVPEKNGTQAAEPAIVPGEYVVMSVADSGSGIDPASLNRIFDPFYTTKEAGKGTGLGLSTVYGIVKQHDGEIRVHSIPGKGTRFDIYFKKSVSRIKTQMKAEPGAAAGGRETILLVEDNSDVRSMARTSLKHYGYQVLEAANGIEAIEVFKRVQGRIDFLFTDVVMPVMGGQDLAKALREQNPGLPILFMSGYTFDVDTAKLAGIKGTDFIQKPMKPVAMARKIRKMLDDAKKSREKQ